MTKREAAIITAYTGVLIGEFADFQRYAEEKMGRPILTHEFSNEVIVQAIKKASNEDFINLMKTLL